MGFAGIGGFLRSGRSAAAPAWSPGDETWSVLLLPGDYVKTGTDGVDAVGTWADSSGNGYDATCATANFAPAAASGCPDFDGAVTGLHLDIPQTLAASGPLLTNDHEGTIVVIWDADAADADVNDAAGDYVNGVLVSAAGATPSCCFSDAGPKLVCYDNVSTFYEAAYGGAAATGQGHIGFFRWSGDGVAPIVLECRRNGGAFVQNVGFTGVDLDNQGGSVEIGRSFAGTLYFDGRIKCVAIFDGVLPDPTCDDFYAWAQAQALVP